MRVLIIGGTGFLGSRTVQALAKLPDAHVTVGYRKRDGRARQARANRPIPPSTRIDLNDPSTFSEMKKHDFVVNTSDTLAAPPTLAIDYALYNGVRFVEAGAHSGTMEELMRRTRGPAADKDGWTGTLLLGMGLFPGLSNLLARQLLQWVGPPDRLDIVVRLNPLAGGGPGLSDEGQARVRGDQRGHRERRSARAAHQRRRRRDGPCLGGQRGHDGHIRSPSWCLSPGRTAGAR
jgi:saccharopine dehydrogenase-like NADP-dependent oxidoreductase